MKPIRIEIRLDCPVDHAWETFSDRESMKLWVQGYDSMRHLSGEEEFAGAVYELTFVEGKRKVVMTQSITALEPPHYFAFEAAATGMQSRSSTRLSADGEGTKIVAENEFFPTNFLMRLLMPLMGGSIRKRIQSDFDRLKKLAEKRYQAQA